MCTILTKTRRCVRLWSGGRRGHAFSDQPLPCGLLVTHLCLVFCVGVGAQAGVVFIDNNETVQQSASNTQRPTTSAGKR